MRRIAIGDIHGGLEALKQVLERLNYDPIDDKLFFVGDYVDGWSESQGVIDMLVNIAYENPKCVFIRGNHDQWFIDFINDGETVAPNHWVNQGGRKTIESYKGHVFQHMSDSFVEGIEIPNNHKEFLRDTVFYHIEKDNKGFVHGGWIHPEGLGNDTKEVYLWDRDIAYMLPLRTNDPLPKRIKAHKEVYIGHTTTLQWRKVLPISLQDSYFNIDTGGGWSGKLTAIDIDTKEIWQSDFVKDLYPNETSR